jgi:hypothetical protein
VAVVIVLAAVAIVFVTGMRPQYDAYGWLVWGRQALHWSLDTNGAPSWKPLPFLFTFPYALFGRAQLWLWLITAVASGLACPVFAGRIAYRLAAPSSQRPWAGYAAAVFAAIGVLALNNWWHFLLIANSDPMNEALCLAAVDFHLLRRYRLAYALLVLAALGRPEVWPFLLLYAAWCWRVRAVGRAWLVLGAFSIPLLWFGIPALTSNSPLIAGDLAEDSVNAVHGARIPGVLQRFITLAPMPIELAALAGLGIAVVRRDRTTLALAGGVVLWVCIEIVFALHGWSAVRRYMFPAGAVTVAIGGAGVGWLLGQPLRIRSPAPILGTWAGPALVLLLSAALVPAARSTARSVHGELSEGRKYARQVDRLDRIVESSGGAAAVVRCGQPVSALGFQSVIAWETGLNVGEIGWTPLPTGGPSHAVIVFEPHGLGWVVRPVNTSASGCRSLRAETPDD